jgi:outer membrane protein TolC
MRRLVLALALLAPGAARAYPPALAGYMDEAVRRHPEIRALRFGYDAQRARIPRAGALPDPMLMVEWSMVPLKYPVNLDKTEMSGVEVGLQQELPFPGKLGFAEEAERYAAMALSARIEEAERALKGSVAQVYYELYFLTRALEITRESQRLLDELARHASVMLTTGRGLKADVLRAQTEAAQLRERIYSLEGRKLAAEARWNYLLSRPVASPVPVPADPGPSPAIPLLSDLLRRAEDVRPALKARFAEIRRAQAEVRRAQRNRYPNFLLGASYRFRIGPEHDTVMGSDFYSLKFGVTLPVWSSSKQSMEVYEARANVRARREELEAERNRIFFDVRRLYEELAKERRSFPLYDGVLRPLSMETLKAAIPPYVTGQVDFHTVLQNWARVYEADLERLRALVAVHAKAAELEAAVGAALNP